MYQRTSKEEHLKSSRLSVFSFNLSITNLYNAQHNFNKNSTKYKKPCFSGVGEGVYCIVH